jgi:hypothetical protein
LEDLMRVLNTVQPKQTFLFCERCSQCPTPIGMWAVAWKVSETTFNEVLLNHKDWIRCVVCLQPMSVQGYATVLDARSERHIVAYIGCEPTRGTIRIVG